MIALPSIAFGGFSGSPKGVTARFVGGRSILSVRCYPAGAASNAQVVQRASVSRITKSFKLLSDERLDGWRRLAESASGQSVFGQRAKLSAKWKSLGNEQILAWNKLALSQQGRSVLGTSAKISGANLFTRLNYWVVACGGAVMTMPPELVGVEALSEATVTLTKDAFTFKLDKVPSDSGGINLVIEASEGQSNGVSRAYGKATQVKIVEEPDDSSIDIKADYEAKNGAVTGAAPRVFFRYFFVNTATGEKSAGRVLTLFI